jgi:hypothetical protein
MDYRAFNAKLLHCLRSQYDSITNNNYTLRIEDGGFSLKVDSSCFLETLCSYYLQKLINRKINIDFLFVIEASLYLSMNCLHCENKTRQKALYLTGILLLNNALDMIN